MVPGILETDQLAALAWKNADLSSDFYEGFCKTQVSNGGIETPRGSERRGVSYMQLYNDNSFVNIINKIIIFWNVEYHK